MYSIVVEPPPTTEDERNHTPVGLAPGERLALGGPVPGASRVLGRAGAAR
ncbi:hypothetical protein ACFU3E_15760 [Streptomyces sp. NPDC057424]